MVEGYFVIAALVFCFWFTKFWGDTTTPKDDRISWVALLVGPLLWPIVLPLSLRELASKKRLKEQEMQDLTEAVIEDKKDKPPAEASEDSPRHD